MSSAFGVLVLVPVPALVQLVKRILWSKRVYSLTQAQHGLVNLLEYLLLEQFLLIVPVELGHLIDDYPRARQRNKESKRERERGGERDTEKKKREREKNMQVIRMPPITSLPQAQYECSVHSIAGTVLS